MPPQWDRREILKAFAWGSVVAGAGGGIESVVPA
jgi:hypothetical protein